VKLNGLEIPAFAGMTGWRELQLEEIEMWSSRNSVIVSSICTKVVIVLVVASAIALPIMLNNGMLDQARLISVDYIRANLGIFYAACVPALVALFFLDRLIANIKKEEIFIKANITALRIISWACLFAAFVFIFGAHSGLGFWIVAFVCAFFSLIIRVVKNVFDAAVRIKDENDFTI
jgi:hypothetical protein